MILAVHLYFDILCSFMIFGSALLFWHFVLICDFWSVLIICIYLCCFMIMAVFVFWHFVLIYDYGYEYGSVLVFFCVLLTNNVFLPFCCCCCCCQRSVNKKWACWLFVRVNFFLCSSPPFHQHRRVAIRVSTQMKDRSLTIKCNPCSFTYQVTA